MIIDFLQSFDSRLDLNNMAAFVLSSNSVKCEDANDYWGVTYRLLDQDKATTDYFSNPSSDSLNYEGVAISQVNTSKSSIDGVREAFYNMYKQADSDVLFLISPNSANWIKRSLKLFEEYNIIPQNKELVFISLQVLHKIATDDFFAAMISSAEGIETLAEDTAFSRKLSLNKLIDIYHPVKNEMCAANESRCNAIWQIANELMTQMPKNEEEI